MRSLRVALVTFVLTAVMGSTVVLVAPASQAAACGDGTLGFSGGSGTTSSPFVIATAPDLIALRDSYAHGYYACVFSQSADISLAISWPHGLGFSTPGSAVWAPFEGIYDGQGHSISNLTIDASGVARANQGRELGFIGLSTSGNAALRNLNLVNASVICGYQTVFAAMLVAETSGSVERSSATGGINCTGADALARMGGLIGYTNGAVADAWVSGTITIPSAYSFQPNTVGGVIGKSDTSSSVQRVLGRVTIVNPADSTYTGAFAGDGQGTRAGDFAQSGLTPGLVDLIPAFTPPINAEFKSAAELQDIATYAGWSISAGINTSTVWGIDPGINGGFPFLQVLPTPGGEMPPILQALPVNSDGTCANLADTHVAYQSGVSGGWGKSWAEWANGGLGGPVCVRTLILSGGRWRIVV